MLNRTFQTRISMDYVESANVWQNTLVLQRDGAMFKLEYKVKQV